VSQDWITKDDKVLIIDDFMAKGYAMRGLIDIVNKAGAQLAGIGVAVEKGFHQHTTTFVVVQPKPPAKPEVLAYL
jgi:adenine/guanine phosphoribosyltransferase-like PRPP-binding protein